MSHIWLEACAACAACAACRAGSSAPIHRKSTGWFCQHSGNSDDIAMGFFVEYTIWLFNIAMENGPFIDGLPIRNGDFPWLC